ncbi:MAG: hypothetical protein HQ500_07285 [Flavobacteriales bacterium]|nr:hypothetical protein [Flavobacteriales bacterium]
MIRKTLIAILLLGMIVPACKKGDEDPFFSLRTRKNRLTGDWKVEQYEKYSDYGPIRSIRYVKDSGLVFLREDSTSFARPFSWVISFKGDGGYTAEMRENFPADSSSTGTAYTLNTVEKGEWKFTGGNGVPNRSELIFLNEEITRERSDQGSNIDIVSISGPIEGEVYSIDRLSNKEFWLSYSTRTSYPFYAERDSLTVHFVKQ